jgi:hypothetical protein
LTKAELAASSTEKEHSSSDKEEGNKEGKHQRKSRPLRHHAKVQSAPMKQISFQANVSERRSTIAN